MDICSFLQVLLLKVCVSIRNVKEPQRSEMVSLSGDRGSGVRDFFPHQRSLDCFNEYCSAYAFAFRSSEVSSVSSVL